MGSKQAVAHTITLELIQKLRKKAAERSKMNRKKAKAQQ
jgi:hypothetical protein